MEKVNKIKYLGLFINFKGEIQDRDNLLPIITKIQNKAKSITWRHTSPLGKTIQTKSLITSKYTHILQNSYPQQDTISDIWKLIESVIWTKTWNERITSRTEISQERISQPIKF